MSQPVPARKPAITGNGKNRIKRPSLKYPRIRRIAPVASVAMAAATTMVVAISRGGAVPDIAVVIATAGPAIATTGISSEIEITPRIGLVTAAIAATTMVVKRAIPRASGTKSRISPKNRRFPRLSERTTARNPQTNPAASVGSALRAPADAQLELFPGGNGGSMRERRKHGA